LREPPVCFVRRLHVHERHLRSSRRDRWTKTSDIFDRFATKRSPKVAKKDEQQRTAVREGADLWRNCYAVVAAVCAHFSSLRASS
jgi:hypothetical protein